jgi:hypothetical protein
MGQARDRVRDVRQGAEGGGGRGRRHLPLGELDKPKKLDPGDHVVEYGVGDSKRKRIEVNLEPGDREEVVLDKLAQMGAGGPARRTSRRTTAAIASTRHPTRAGRGD